MSVERVNASDIELVLYVINTSNSDAYRSLIPLEQFKDPILTLEELMREFSNMRFYAYKSRNKFVGVAALRIDEGETGIVRWVHVLPEHRRKGVGSSLMEHVESEAKYLGLKRLRVVYVWERAYWAKNFYAKLGYQKRDTVTLPWGDTAHIYERILH
ncbi:MAG: GNAT family N-acetyltransferase [Candidatus Bathyarchaeia archaeon]|jgi:N-acetylglutamate synthase-like GNAT family acetyltransferase